MPGPAASKGARPAPSRVVAVIVSYQPEFEALKRLLTAVLPQVAAAVVVDNGSQAAVGAWLGDHFPGSLNFIGLGRNQGVACAQNRGIDWARRRGGDCVLLLDQDSEPAADMVSTLAAALESLQSQGVMVACVGPRYLDERQDNPPPFIRVRGLHLERCPCPVPEAVVAVDYLISSGSLLPLAALEKVGGMREDLFIDYVDIEWGLRARRLGYQSFGVCAARMRHALGEDPIGFWGRNFPRHSPLRHYYHFRNAALLCREGWVPLNWKVVDVWRLCLKYVFYCLLAKPRWEHCRSMSRGFWHGLRGKTGEFGAG